MLFALALLNLAQSSTVSSTPAALSWRFVQVEMPWYDVDAVDERLRGIGAHGAWEFQDGLFVQGGFQALSGDARLRRWDVGIGHHVTVRTGVDGFGVLSYRGVRLDDAGTADADERGWRLEGGVRSLLSPSVEVEVRGGWENVVDSGLVWGTDVRWWWQERVALGLGYERGVHDGVWMLSLRYAF